MGGFAWVTLATNDPYSLGALVLAHSLKQVGTKHDIAILITPGVTPAMREKLATVFSFVQEVNVLDSQDQANLALLARPELGITFTKLHCWRLTQYDKCVFVDADALVVRNCDELFEREELSAAPDVGWPDCFNSGVFVFKPSQQTFASLTAFAVSKGSFDGGDQGLLNLYFSDWAHKDISKHLPFIYNMCSTASYSYLPAYKQFGADVRIIHFIGSTKPWLQYFDTQTSQVHPTSGLGHLQSLLQQWWNIFCEHVHPQLSSDMTSSTLALHWHNFRQPVSTAHPQSTHTCHDATDQTYDEVDSLKLIKPDFTEFHDPWKDYYESQNQPDNQTNQPTIISSHSQKSKTTEAISKNELPSISHTRIIKFSSIADEKNIQILNHDKLSREHNNTNELNSSFIENHDDKIQIEHETPRYEIHECLHDEIKLSDNSICRIDQLTVQKPSKNEPCSQLQDRLIDVDIVDGKNCQLTCDCDVVDNQSCFEPCTEPDAIARQSETKGELEQMQDAGIAGALANITLGEPRTSEQDAYEEHMRKQSWEQGQIDYMGRDSFDNIWKKICTTLSTPFENEPAPTENLSSEQTNEAAAKFSSSSTQSAAELPSTAEESGAISPTMLALSPPLMKLAIKEAGEKTIKPSRKSREIEEPQTPTVIPLGPPPSLQAQAEAAVPIQVAESVLEADIKESVSEDIKPVTEEAISSISAPVQESISAIVEAPLEPPVPVRSQPVEASVVSQANGSSVLEAELAVDEEGICPLKARVELLSSPKPLGVDGNQVGTDFKASGTSSAPPLQIPATPKVIEATPPTSPPLDPPGDSKLVGDEPKTPKKVVKKSVKKSGSPEEKEGGALDDGKKTKKVVKKVGSSSSAVEAKKDDGAEAAGSPLDKPKKIVKVKKTTKPSQTLETDTSVPETPPPVASETPIPPKRKVKSVTAKTTTKKSESES